MAFKDIDGESCFCESPYSELNHMASTQETSRVSHRHLQQCSSPETIELKVRRVELEVEELRENITSLSSNLRPQQPAAEACTTDPDLIQQVNLIQQSLQVLYSRLEELTATMDHSNEKTEGKVEELHKQVQQIREENRHLLSHCPVPTKAPEDPESALLLESSTPVPTKQDPGTT